MMTKICSIFGDCLIMEKDRENIIKYLNGFNNKYDMNKPWLKCILFFFLLFSLNDFNLLRKQNTNLFIILLAKTSKYKKYYKLFKKLYKYKTKERGLNKYIYIPYIFYLIITYILCRYQLLFRSFFFISYFYFILLYFLLLFVAYRLDRNIYLPSTYKFSRIQILCHLH